MKTRKAGWKLPYILISTTVFSLCPMLTYAATAAAVDFQSIAVETLNNNTAVEENYINEYTEIEETESGDIDEPMLDEILPVSGNVDVDVNIESGSRVITNAINLDKGDEVDAYLVSDNSYDSFKVGLLDKKNRKTYVKSKKGRVLYTFKVKKNGEYRLFLEGNDKTKNMHISGYVYIKN